MTANPLTVDMFMNTQAEIRVLLKQAVKEIWEQDRKQDEEDQALLDVRPRLSESSFAHKLLQMLEQGKADGNPDMALQPTSSKPMESALSSSSTSEVEGMTGTRRINGKKFDTFAQKPNYRVFLPESAADESSGSLSQRGRTSKANAAAKRRSANQSAPPTPAADAEPAEPLRLGEPIISHIIRPRKRQKLSADPPVAPVAPYQHIVEAKYTPIPSYDFVIPVVNSAPMVEDPVTYHTMPSFTVQEGWEAKERSVLRYTWEQLQDADTAFLDDYDTNPRVRDPFLDRVLFKTAQDFFAVHDIDPTIFETISHVHEIQSDDMLVEWLLEAHDNQHRAKWTDFLRKVCEELKAVLGRPVVEIMDNYRVIKSGAHRRPHVKHRPEGRGDEWKSLCPVHLLYACPLHCAYPAEPYATDSRSSTRITQVKGRKPNAVANNLEAPTVDEACSEHCRISIDFDPRMFERFRRASFKDITHSWTATDRELFVMCMTNLFEPTPCQLAVMIPAHSCVELSFARAAYLKDQRALPPAESDVTVENKDDSTHVSAQEKSRKSKSSKHNDQDEIYKALKPNQTGGYEPCQHPGKACGDPDHCSCAANDTYCDKFCGCSIKCERRFPGCFHTCHHHGSQYTAQNCRDDKCPCEQAGRECDPELCCGPAPHKGLCHNMQLQRGAKKRNYVGVSEVEGFGLYLGEAAEEGDLVQEYTGEFVDESGASIRAAMLAKRRKTYFYELDRRGGIDSEHYGNRTRYINNPPNGQGSKKKEPANCTAAVKYVLGENRIGIYLTKRIKPGDELLMDYGELYFFSVPA